MNQISKEIVINDQKIVLETGKIARQANGSVLVSCEGTSILATVAGRKEASEGQSFFPLSVNYQEKTYAAGKIPGGFFKREGRPSEKETLISRLIDRPLRPSFPDNFLNEIQVVLTVVSLNPEVQTDILSMIGASAAISISDIPFNGPIGGARVGYIDNKFVINPTVSQMENSKLDLIVAGTKEAILMVESEVDILSEEIMLDAVMAGHEAIKDTIQGIDGLVEQTGKEKWIIETVKEDEKLKTIVNDLAFEKIKTAYQTADKVDRQNQLEEIKNFTLDAFNTEDNEEYESSDVLSLVKKIEKEIVRSQILNGDARIDGRDTETVRDINIELNILERAHGSALFTRGETQALVATTLGTERSSQIIDALEGEYKDKFMLHYNFPPYSVGETGFMGSPKRREIGHGKLARRSLEAVLPDMDTFPYAIRLVSEITESNGSSSMATVCGTSLALMDAGVPIKEPVAGIAMGLIKEGDDFSVLSDILGDEDHLGDMDFKVAGTKDGITSLQMDIKITGITFEIMEQALKQAKDGRIHILGEMNKAINKSRDGVGKHTPKMEKITVDKKDIATVIGKGGATIREIVEKSGAKVDVNDEGVVTVAAPDEESRSIALQIIKDLTAKAEMNKIYNGKVIKIMEFGAFVNFLGKQDGLVHISELANKRVAKVTDVVKEGDEVKVKVIGFDRGKVKLSIKQAVA